MNIVITTEQFNLNHIFFQDSIINTVINNSIFIRIYYSNNDFILNGIFIVFDLLDITIEQYFNKYKYTFKNNNDTVYNLCNIERELMHKYMLSQNKDFKKKQNTVLYDQLSQGFIKLYTECKCLHRNARILIKISGIWENETEYGITYKFVHII